MRSRAEPGNEDEDVLCTAELGTTLRTLARAEPFRPFAIELVSGTRFEVHHPEALAWSGGVAVYIPPDGGPIIFDDESVSQIVARVPRGKRGNK